MSQKFFLLVVLGLIALIDNSESIRCYDCTSVIDGENCHNGNNLREVNCPEYNYCAKITGQRMWLIVNFLKICLTFLFLIFENSICD